MANIIDGWRTLKTHGAFTGGGGADICIFIGFSAVNVCSYFKPLLSRKLEMVALCGLAMTVPLSNTLL